MMFQLVFTDGTGKRYKISDSQPAYVTIYYTYSYRNHSHGISSITKQSGLSESAITNLGRKYLLYACHKNNTTTSALLSDRCL